MDAVRASLEALLNELAPIGRHDESGGYRRFAWTEADLACRQWFERQAHSRDLPTELDQNGNLWAWFPAPPAPDGRAVATGSHLDSVPDGGPLDGPLGVVSAFLALDELRGDTTWKQARPIAVVDFADEEGARFGAACVGSRLLTGALSPERARVLADRDGITLPTALSGASVDAEGLGRDDDRLARLSCFVELHVEQGKALAPMGSALGLATAIWPHGRWRFDLDGEANHAGTTRLDDRRDPAVCLAAMVSAARRLATEAGGVATVGRVQVLPNSTNSVPSKVTAWLDARAPDEEALERIVRGVVVEVEVAAAQERVLASVTEESRSPAVEFDRDLRARIDAVLGGIPAIPTGAGHDAGVLASHIPTAMLFVRNPTGVSHSPAETADLDDCAAGVRALTQVLRELAG